MCICVGKLTAYGKKQLTAGLLSCEPSDIRYTGDPLLAPYCSYEFRPLTHLMTYTSHRLNLRYALPLKSESISWTWGIVLTEAWRGRMDENILISIIKCFRFNLRIFVTYYNMFSTILCIWLLYICLPTVWVKVIGVSCLLILTLLFTYLERYRRVRITTV